jgi:hypothetical protein
VARQVMIETDEVARRSLKILAAHSGEIMKDALGRLVADALKKREVKP